MLLPNILRYPVLQHVSHVCSVVVASNREENALFAPKHYWEEVLWTWELLQFSVASVINYTSTLLVLHILLSNVRTASADIERVMDLD